MVRVPDAAGQVRSAPVKAVRGFFAGIGQLLLTADWFRAEETTRAPAGPEQENERGAGRSRTAPEPSSRDQASQDGAAEAGRDSDRDNRRARDNRAGRDNRAARHRATGLQGPAASAQSPTRRFRSLDSTGNVRLLTPDDAAGATGEDPSAPWEQPAQAEPPLRAEPPPRAEPPARAQPPVPVQPAAPPGPPATAPVPAPRTPAAVSPADLPVLGYDQLTLASLRSRLRYLDAAQLRVLADYEKATANRAEVVGMFERRITKLQAASAHAT